MARARWRPSAALPRFPWMKHKAGSMGKPVPGWYIELHDDEGKPVGVGEEGRIAIKLDPRPVGLFVEHLDNPEANKEAFQIGSTTPAIKPTWTRMATSGSLGAATTSSSLPATGSGRSRSRARSWSTRPSRRQRFEAAGPHPGMIVKAFDHPKNRATSHLNRWSEIFRLMVRNTTALAQVSSINRVCRESSKDHLRKDPAQHPA